MAILNDSVASYTGHGNRKIIQQTFFQTIPWPRSIDPLAQTFLLAEDKYITSIDLFFATKEDGKDITVQIREVANGYPTINVIANVVLNSSQIKTSPDGSVATRATFSDPVLLNANTDYCFVVLTTSAQYRLWVAKMSGTDQITKQKVSRQPYTVGVLFSSSNATTWTAHQDMDIKFRLYGAKFKQSSVLAFQPMTVEKATRLVLAANQLVPRGGNIIWQWSKDGVSWYALGDSEVTRLGEELDLVHLRAVLTSNGSSAVIEDGAGAVALSYKDEGVYVSREITSNEPFTKVTVYVDLHTPSGTDQFLEYSLDNVNWIGFGSEASKTTVDSEFNQYKFEADIENAYKIRVRVNQKSNLPILTPKARRLMVHLT
ncbi:hypothetical protein [Sporosarcina sp. Marseille-Q4943]|uniref:hypothetical protein n=1 Tax=Sporosarcina sp. Marseille-Q4943 TaxID=2942204 RepID=UPI00208DA69F|nr:hypothetical protein [Sporosarcina sp. Marseille-Q4943]